MIWGCLYDLRNHQLVNVIGWLQIIAGDNTQKGYNFINPVDCTVIFAFKSWCRWNVGEMTRVVYRDHVKTCHWLLSPNDFKTFLGCQ